MLGYRYRIEYKAGKKNTVADQLSRPVRIARCVREERWLCKTKEQIMEMQRKETNCTEILVLGRRLNTTSKISTKNFRSICNRSRRSIPYQT